MKKKITYLIIGVLLIVGVLFVSSWRNNTIKQEYEKIIIEKGDVHKMTNVDAIITPDNYANISSEIPAVIEWIGVKKNEQVEAGQELLRLNEDAINAQVKNAELAVERAELAEKEARRQWDMLKPEAKESIKKATEQSRQKLNEINAQAEKRVITSPINGIVIEQNARVGDIASGTIMRIINPNTLQLEALIPEVDFAKVHTGNNAFVVFDAYPDKIITGKLQTVDTSSTIEQNSTYYKALINIDKEEGVTILDGMNAEVDIEIDRKNNVTVVPRNLAKKDDSGYFVYILNEKDKKNPLVKKYFKAGLVGKENIEIISGIRLGEEIVKPLKVE